MEATKKLVASICASLNIGAAAGALQGGFFLTPNFQHEVLLFTTFGLTVLFFMQSVRLNERPYILWK